MSKPIDLTTQYLGLTLKNPLVASASPMSTNVDYLKKLEAAGVSAIVLPSLFQEQIESLEDAYDALAFHNSPEATDDYLPLMGPTGPYGVTPDNYIQLVTKAKAAVSIPVIASLNGYTDSGWLYYAKRLQDAGADALELNIYHVSTDLDESSKQLEDGYIKIIEKIRKEIHIPIAVKISPFNTALANFSKRLVRAGANGLVIFNRVMHPDIDTQQLKLTANFTFSKTDEYRLPLQWIGLLAKRLDASLAASTGVETSEQVVKYLLAGADVVMTTGALLRHGPEYATQLLEGLTDWLKAHDQTSLTLMRGQMCWAKLKNNRAYIRTQYIKSVGSYQRS